MKPSYAVRFVAIGALATLASPASWAADATVEEVISRHIEAIGGTEKVRAVETLRKTGIYVYNGLEHPIVIVQKRGVGAREEIDGLTQWGTTTAKGMTTVRVAKGDQAWIRKQAESDEAQPIEGFELSAFLQDSSPESALVDHKAKGHAIDLVGREVVDGTEAIHLSIVFAGGERQEWYLDSETYLLIRRSREVPDDDYQSPRIWYYDDYREVAGVQMPFFVQIEENLFARDYIFERIEVNVPLEASLFEIR